MNNIDDDEVHNERWRRLEQLRSHPDRGPLEISNRTISMSAAEAAEVEAAAAAEGMTCSQWIRRAIQRDLAVTTAPERPATSTTRPA